MLKLGEIIKINRKEMGYSQEDLSNGVCAVANLSRIENGKSLPSRATFEALMEKMGLSAGAYMSIFTDQDKLAFELKHEFNELFARSEYKEAEKILNELEVTPGQDKVYERFIMMARILIKQVNGIDPKEILKEHEKALPIFMADFSPSKIKKSLLTKLEINMLHAYALANHAAGNPDMAIEILYELIAYVESKVYDKEGISTMYTKLLSSISSYVGLSGDNIEALRLCEMGIKSCIKYNRYKYFPYLLYNKGYGLISTGNVDEGHKCIRQSYYIMSALGDTHNKMLQYIMAYAKEMNIELL